MNQLAHDASEEASAILFRREKRIHARHKDRVALQADL